MTSDFVTTRTFNKAMQRIDERFGSIDKRFAAVDERFKQIDKRFDVIEKKIEDQGIMIRKDTREFFDIFMEHVDHRFQAMMEHPLFSNYKAG